MDEYQDGTLQFGLMGIVLATMAWLCLTWPLFLLFLVFLAVNWHGRRFTGATRANLLLLTAMFALKALGW